MQSLLDRFSSKVEPCPATGCWLWTACITRGYGRFKLDGVLAIAHRVSWELHVGPIPDGMYVLHRCDVRSCVNPNHLFLGTQLDNMKDASSKDRLHRKSLDLTHCKRGHEFTEENIRTVKGIRHCRACGRIRTFDWYQRKKAKHSLEQVRQQ